MASHVSSLVSFPNFSYSQKYVPCFPNNSRPLNLFSSSHVFSRSDPRTQKNLESSHFSGQNKKKDRGTKNNISCHREGETEGNPIFSGGGAKKSTPVVQSSLRKTVRTDVRKGGFGFLGVDGRTRGGKRDRKRNGITCQAVPDLPALDESLVLTELPCLPFSPTEVFVPASTKTLHLYEARFLALLDEVMAKRQNLFAHVVIQQVGGAAERGSVVAAYACLAHVESVRRSTVGALVTVRGIGRAKLVGFTQLEPYLRGTVIPLKDEVVEDKLVLEESVRELRSVLGDVQKLQIKIRSSVDEPLQTPLERALEWADKAEKEDFGGPYLPSLSERISFAALQPLTGASPAELHRLLQLRLTSMETVNTLQRLKTVLEHVKESRATLAAKVALQDLKL